MIKKSKKIRIVDDTSKTKEDKIIIISKVKYLYDYILEIHFDDDVVQNVDFAPFLISSPHPEVKKYLNVLLFKDYTLDNGQLYWGDYDLIFPIIDLYTNDIKPYISTKISSSNLRGNTEMNEFLLYHYWVSTQNKNNIDDFKIESNWKNKLHSLLDEILKITSNLNKEPVISILSLLSKKKKLSTNEILSQVNIDKTEFYNQVNIVGKAHVFKCYKKENIDYWELNEKLFLSLCNLSSELVEEDKY